MCRAFGLVSNDPKRLECFLYARRQELAPRPGDRPDGVGIGYYVNLEPLLSKRPAPADGELTCYRFAKGIHADALLMHGSFQPGEPWKVENTHPFRFRNWIFAHTGAIAGFDAVATKLYLALPGHLQRNIRGSTDSEVAFHIFMDLLGRKRPVDASDLRTADVAAALTRTVAIIEDATQSAGPSVMNFIAMNGQILAGVRLGAPMSLVRFSGIPDCAVCKLDSKSLNADNIAAAHRRFTAVVLASEPHRKMPGAIELPDRSVITVGPDLSHAVAQF